MSPPIFIVGSKRSGSTLLRLILDAHPNIAIPEETGFMGAVSAATSIPQWKYGQGWYQRIGWTDEEIEHLLNEYYQSLFGRFAATQGKGRWGEKTPNHTFHIPQMARVFPDAVFVGIVRHPGAVCASLTRRFNYSFPDALAYWSMANRELVVQGGRLGRARFVLCRYEDLVVRVEPTLRALIEWLGEPWSPRLLQHQDVQREKNAPLLVDGNTRTRDPVDPTKADRWVDEISEGELEQLRAGATEFSAFFGYQVDKPLDGLDDLHLGREVLVNGDMLAERMRHWSASIDWEARATELYTDVPRDELAQRLRKAEAALSRIRSRPAVRLSDLVRRTQRSAVSWVPRRPRRRSRGATR